MKNNKKNINVSKLDVKNLKKINLNTYIRKNSFFDFSKVIVKKPWGFEFLLYQNKKLAIWFLYLKKNQKTSFHCHIRKKTILYVLKGSIFFKSLKFSKKYNEGEYVQIGKKVFHQSKSISQKGSIVLELESPVNKNDLVRLSDDYGRTGIGYESRFKKIININKLKKDIIYKKITIDRLKNSNMKKKKFPYSLFVLKGGLKINGKKFSVGSIISQNNFRNAKISKNSLFLFIKKKYAIENKKINNILNKI